MSKLKRIPIARAKEIAQKYDYDQVIIIARKETEPDRASDWCTTYGRNRRHCDIAARVRAYLMDCLYYGPSKRKPNAGLTDQTNE